MSVITTQDGTGGKKSHARQFGDHAYHIMLPKPWRAKPRMRWTHTAEHNMRAEWAAKAPRYNVPDHLKAANCHTIGYRTGLETANSAV